LAEELLREEAGTERGEGRLAGERRAVWKGVGVADAVLLLARCGGDGRECRADRSEGFSQRVFLHVNLAKYRMALRLNRSKINNNNGWAGCLMILQKFVICYRFAGS